MDLLDRYLGAIRWQLPAAKADDILAELRDVLLARQEDREEALGRALTRAEASALIKEFGHPLIVAARYRPQQWLIGPDVFPFYMFVLRITALVIVAVQVALSVARGLFAGQPAVPLLGHAAGEIWMSLIVDVGVITIIFALLERAGFPADHLRRWSPEQLPGHSHKPKRAWEVGCEIAFGILFVLWWAGAIRIPTYGDTASFRMALGPVFATLYWPILGLGVARLIQTVVGWWRPRWRLLHGVLVVGTTIAGLALLAVIYRAGSWVTIVPGTMPADQAAQLGEAVNFSLKMGLIAVAAAWAWQGATDLWRLLRGTPA